MEYGLYSLRCGCLVEGRHLVDSFGRIKKGYKKTMVSISKTLGKLICWVFQYNVCWKNLWKCLGAFLLVPYFQNMIEWVPLTRGNSPYFILGSNIFFLAVIPLFDITNLSKCFNHSGNLCKMIKFRQEDWNSI